MIIKLKYIVGCLCDKGGEFMVRKVITFVLITLLTMGLVITPYSSQMVWASESYNITVESYENFFDYIKQSMLNFKENISIRINNYDENVYDFNKVMGEVIDKNPEIYYHYGRVSGSIRSYYSNQTYRIIDIHFRYSGTRDELENLVKVRNYDEYKDAITNTLKHFDNRMLIKIHNYDEKQYNLDDTIYKVLSETADLDYGINGWSYIVYGSGKDKIIESYINYNFTKEKMLEMKEAVGKKAKQIIAKLITSDMKDYEKQLVLHDYIVNNSQYNANYYEVNSIPDDEHTAYGVLIKGTGICSSYAKAMHKLLDMVGIESYFVSGIAGEEPHAWNIVKIQGEYYHLDSTWNDPIMSDGSDFLSHDYFNLSDNLIAVTHSWDREKYPKCNSLMYSYDNISKILSGEIKPPDYDNINFKTINQLPNNTVVMGYNAFDIDFANNPENREIIKSSLNKEAKTYIYVKFNDKWFNTDGSDAKIENIPTVNYTKDGQSYESYLSLDTNSTQKDNIIVKVEKLTVGANISVSIDIRGEEDYSQAVEYRITESDKIGKLGEKIFIFPHKKSGDVITVELLDKNQDLIAAKNVNVINYISKPNNLKATAISHDKIQLYWDEVDYADYYYLYEALSFEGPYQPYHDDNGKLTKYYWDSDFCLEIYDLDPDTTLYFKVTSVKDGVESEFSNIASITTFDNIESQSLYLVKNSNLYNYNQATISEAFDTYFTNTKWEYFESLEGDDVIEFTGQCYYGGELSNILIQFTVNLDDESFYVNYKEKDEEFMLDSYWINLLNSIFKR